MITFIFKVAKLIFCVSAEQGSKKMFSGFNTVKLAFEFGGTLPFIVVHEPVTEVFISFLTKCLTTQIHRPKNFSSAGSLCRPFVTRPQFKCPRRTFILPQKYHASVSNMLSYPIRYFIENETNINFTEQTWSDSLQSTGSRALFTPLVSRPKFLPKILAYFS